MKKINQIAICIAVCFAITLSINAQPFNQIGGGTTYNTPNTVTNIAVGTFAGTFNSAFEIHGESMPTATGLVFSTNGPSATATNWKMSQNGTETFRVENAASSNNVAIGTVASGDLYMFTNGTTNTKVTIKSGGNIGIGTTSPNYLLHQDVSGNTTTYHQFTNGNTGTTSSDGLIIGLTYDGVPGKSYAEFNQQENARMNFLTQGIQRMSIVAGGTGALTGYVGIGNNFSDPQSRLHINQGTSETCYLQMTGNNMYSSAASIDGFRIGVLNPNGGPYDVEFRQQENSSDYVWYTTPTGTTAVERMRMKSDGKVGIGTTSPAALVDASLTGVSGLNVVYGATLTNAVNSVNNIGNYTVVNSSGTGCHNYGVYAAVNCSGSGDYGYGGLFTAVGASLIARGVVAAAQNAPDNFGIEASADGGTNSTGLRVTAQEASNDVMGVWSLAVGDNVSSNDVHGVHTEGRENNGTYSTVYGIWAKGPAPGTSCSSPGGVLTCAKAAGYFNGDIGVTGSVYVTSDINLKDSILPLQNASGILSQLNPKTFKFKTQAYPSMSLSKVPQFGLIAQEIATVIPQVVRVLREPEVKDTLGNIVYQAVDFETVNYIALITILIGGFQEQQAQIDSLITVIANGNKQNNNQNNNQQQKTGAIEVELNNVSKVIQLFQNDPNPFHEQTRIDFYIPDNIGKAEIWFVDNNGTVLKKVPITERGEGSMIVMGSNLTSGTYSYNLIADGKIIDGKKMIKVK